MSNSPLDPKMLLNISKKFEWTDNVVGCGHGGRVKVYIVHQRTIQGTKTAPKLACKMAPCSRDKPKPLGCITEYLLRQDLVHPNILKIIHIGTDNLNRFITSELATKGDLYSYIYDPSAGGPGGLTEADLRPIAYQLFQGLAHLHGKGIAHMDIKLDNILLSSEQGRIRIIIADFDFAGYYDRQGPGSFKERAQQLQYLCGTPDYASPETIWTTKDDDYKYTHLDRADIWAMALVIYESATGDNDVYEHVFHGFTNQKQNYGIVKKARSLICLRPKWKTLSLDLTKLLSEMLQEEPHERLTALQALQQDWFKSHQPALEEGYQTTILNWTALPDGPEFDDWTNGGRPGMPHWVKSFSGKMSRKTSRGSIDIKDLKPRDSF